ncbi:MAG: serine--tRNA ligase, partial [Desulfomonilaceae bacterium]
MLDINFIRNNVEVVKQGILKKKMQMDVDELLDLDLQLRKTKSEVEELRAERNRLSKEIASARGDDRDRMIERVKVLKDNLSNLEPELRRMEERFETLMLLVPNPPLPEVPDGDSDEDNVEVRRFGAPPRFTFPPKDHLELAEELDIVDMGRASKFSGARMYVLKNEGALLEFALFKFALDILVERGYRPMIVPQLVRRQAMIGTGFFPLGEEDTFYVEKDDLYLIGTAEVSLV